MADDLMGDIKAAAKTVVPDQGMVAPRYLAMDAMPPGMVEQGNIDIMRTPGGVDGRPAIRIDPEDPRDYPSSVRSLSFGDENGHEILIPTVTHEDGYLTDDDAIDRFRRTGLHLGKFDHPDAATAYGEALHKQQEGMFGPSSDLGFDPEKDYRPVSFAPPQQAPETQGGAAAGLAKLLSDQKQRGGAAGILGVKRPPSMNAGGAAPQDAFVMGNRG